MFAYKPAKVFRKRFSSDFELNTELKNEGISEDIIKYDEEDVTYEYVKAYDVTIPIHYPDERYKDKKFAFICVFDNEQWIIVHWGKIKSGEMHFKNMASDAVYIGTYYDMGKIVLATKPFNIDNEGNITIYDAYKTNLQTFRLERK